MSLDLTMLPIEGDNGTYAFSHTVLGLNQGSMWWDLLQNVRMSDVPDNFNTYLCRNGGEPHYGDTQTTPYGEQLRYARVQDILSAVDKHGVADDWSKRDKAVVAYLRMLDPKTKIALYWH